MLYKLTAVWHYRYVWLTLTIYIMCCEVTSDRLSVVGTLTVSCMPQLSHVLRPGVHFYRNLMFYLTCAVFSSWTHPTNHLIMNTPYQPPAHTLPTTSSWPHLKQCGLWWVGAAAAIAWGTCKYLPCPSTPGLARRTTTSPQTNKIDSDIMAPSRNVDNVSPPYWNELGLHDKDIHFVLWF